MRKLGFVLLFLAFLFFGNCSGTFDINKAAEWTDIGITLALSQSLEFEYNKISADEQVVFVDRLREATKVVRSQILFTLYDLAKPVQLDLDIFFNMLGEKLSISQKMAIQLVVDKIVIVVQKKLKAILPEDVRKIAIAIFEPIADCMDIFVSSHESLTFTFGINFGGVYGNTN